jgi:hypothetical protein
VPSYLPTQVIQKQPKLWQQALAQLLTQAAGQVVGQGVQNVMSRDYAPEFGLEKAGLVEKLMSGPRANEKTFQMKAQNKAAFEMENLRNTNDRTNREYTAQQQNLRDEGEWQKEKALKGAGFRHAEGLQKGENELRRLQMELSSTERQIGEEEALRRQEAEQIFRRIMALKEQQALEPGRTADINKKNAETEAIREQQELSRSLMKQRLAQSQTQVNPNIAKDRLGQNISNLAPSVATALQNPNYVRPSGSVGYPTADEVLSSGQTNTTPSNDPRLRALIGNIPPPITDGRPASAVLDDLISFFSALNPNK